MYTGEKAIGVSASYGLAEIRPNPRAARWSEAGKSVKNSN